MPRQSTSRVARRDAARSHLAEPRWLVFASARYRLVPVAKDCKASTIAVTSIPDTDRGDQMPRLHEAAVLRRHGPPATAMTALLTVYMSTTSNAPPALSSTCSPVLGKNAPPGLVSWTLGLGWRRAGIRQVQG
ncbi:hypothetical protein J1614_011356 [Plenodomus biglobosus]|nr:hypothetical protein J1614_011356 [Plenodomus biglobosus]